MSDDNLSKTLIIPNPGGRRKGGEQLSSATAASNAMPSSQVPSNSVPSNSVPSNPTSSPLAPYGSDQFNPSPASGQMPQGMGQAVEFSQVSGENIILTFGSEILTLASNIRSLEPKNSIEQLRQDIEQLITKFDSQLSNANVSKEVSLTARYIMCCLLDELVLSTPWGADSVWSHQTLLGKYHNETSGGEKFFLIVNKLLEQAQRNIDLIELCYVCISSGFSGKYRISQQGEQELLQVGQLLYQHIEQQRPTGRDLSPNWQGVGVQTKSFVKQFPSWVFFLGLGSILLIVYIGFLSSLNAKVEPIYQKLESIGWDDFVLKMNKSQPESVDVNTIASSMKSYFSKEIANQMVAIDVRENMLVIRLKSTSLFKSGSSILNEDALPDVNRLVNSIKEHADSVLVIGHTDSTGKADSNWVISRKRAEAVAKWLSKGNFQLTNTVTRGMADKQPLIDDSDSTYNRSLNRRVELILVLKG